MAAAALFLGCARRRRLFGCDRNLNLNRAVAFSTATDSTQQQQQPPAIDPLPVKESLLKGVEGTENWELFKSWMLKYERSYESEKETLFRYTIFCQSQEEVEMWNKEDPRCEYALNCFADRTLRDYSPYRDYVYPIHRAELSRAFFTSDLTQQQVGVKKSLLKGVEGSENWRLFKSWMLEYNKNYYSEVETLYRYDVFCTAKKEVEMLNKEDTGCKYTLNFFSDITPFDLPPKYRFGMVRFRMSRSTLI